MPKIIDLLKARDANGDVQVNLAVASCSHTLAQIIILGYFV